MVHGGYGRVFTDEEALAPRIATWGYEDKTSITFVVQALSDDILHQIKTFTEKEELTVDVDQVLDGDGFIILHYHNLSKIMTEKSKKTIGMPMNIYNLAGKRQPVFPAAVIWILRRRVCLSLRPLGTVAVSYTFSPVKKPFKR